jgi:hypothetical protein
MPFGLLALIFAVAAAGLLLWRLTRGDVAGGDTRNMTILKLVVWLGLTAALFAAKLWPLAFMVLFAAGGVMAIELWRERNISEEKDRDRALAPTKRAMTKEEAASVLGLMPGANVDDIRAAHRRLISQIHPDKGGTDYLAAKINEARDVMLKAIGTDD